MPTKRNIMILSLMLLFAAMSAQLCFAADTVTVMSFNIRYNNSGDGDNAWPQRKDIAASMIRFHKADIAGLQEALKGQLDDLADRLPDYSWFGVGRDDGKEAGEYSCIFYRKDRLELLDSDTFWLSANPSTFGIGWDAVCNRVVTWGKFRDKATGKVFFHFNTHFDHKGVVARRESAKLLLAKVAEIAGNTPATVSGDFNAKPGDEPVRIITGGLAGKPGTKLSDSKEISATPHHGPTGTWSGFENAGKPGDEPIDYIFVRNGVKVLRHGTLSDSFDGRFPSDHMPVLADVSF